MVSAVISRAAIIVFGLLFPAYKSFKAVRSKNVKEYVKWMMYWIVFAMFCAIEIFLDVFVSFWCPFYYELKILFVLYLLTPYTKGASVLYRKFIHPLLVKHEGEIDAFLDQAKESSMNTFMRIGSQTVVATREAVTNVLLDRMTRSHSLGDVSVDPRHPQCNNVVIQEIIEEDEGEYRPRTSTAPMSPYIDDEEDFIDLADEDYRPSPTSGAHARANASIQIRSPSARTKARAQYQPGHSVHTEFGTMTPTQAQRITRSTAARTRRPLHTDTYDAPQ